MKASSGSSASFMNPDLPIQARVPKSFLFAFKRLLVEWEFSKGSIYVDTSAQILSVEGKLVVMAEVKDYEMGLQWFSPAWSDWTLLLRDDSKFQELQEPKHFRARVKARPPD